MFRVKWRAVKSDEARHTQQKRGDNHRAKVSVGHTELCLGGEGCIIKQMLFHHMGTEQSNMGGGPSPAISFLFPLRSPSLAHTA